MTTIHDTSIMDVLSYIQDYGIMFGTTWRLGMETATGNNLILRDITSSMNGVNARYEFSTGVYVDL